MTDLTCPESPESAKVLAFCQDLGAFIQEHPEDETKVILESMMIALHAFAVHNCERTEKGFRDGLKCVGLMWDSCHTSSLDSIPEMLQNASSSTLH